MRLGGLMPSLRQDLRFGLRMLWGTPGFTAVAVITLAVGIAVNTTVFGWIDSVLLEPISGARGTDQLAFLETVTSRGEYLVNMSYTDYCDYRDHLKLIAGLAVARLTPLTIGNGRPERAWAELVSANYFDLLQVKPVLGRGFLPDEGGEEPGSHPVCIISNRMWRNRFGGDPGVLGRKIRLNRRELTIIGVAPPEFRGATAGLAYDVWMPIGMATEMGTGRGTLGYRGTRDIGSTVARLKPGVTLEQARAEVEAFARTMAGLYPATNRSIGATLMPLWGSHNGAQRLLLRPLHLLMAVCLLLLLIVCANVANLLLARAVSRQKEFGIRIALGAGRTRLARQLLTETLLLATAGALLGVLLSLWMAQSLTLLLPPNDFPIALGTPFTARTLGFTVLLAMAATLISGTAPALLSTHSDLNETLKEGGRSGASGAHSHRLRSLLVIAEVALATVALAGAGLFFRSFRNATAIDPGFGTGNIAVAQFYLSSAGYSAEEQRLFCRTLRERLERLPGVQRVSYSDVIPLTFGSSPWHQLQVEGYVPARNEDMNIHRALVPPGFFDLMGIPLREGRDFTERDEAGAPPVIIVNETFARRFFAGANPIGRKVRVEGQPRTVVGLARDSKYHDPAEAPLPYFYAPFRQIFSPGLNFVFYVKTAGGDPMAIVEAMRREALALNGDAIFNATPLAQAVTAALYPQRVAARLLIVLGVVSLFLAALGLYSVMSYSVSRRTQELGIRMALGAQPADVRALVMRQGAALAAPGLLLGIAGALSAGRVVEGMLVQVSPADPATLASATAFLGAIALLASYVPARRAIRINPIAALRCQ